MIPFSRSAFGSWWIEHNAAVLRKAVSRWLPARMSDALRTFQSRYATPTVMIDPEMRSLTLLPQSPDATAHSVPATPEGMAHLASLCADRRPLLRISRRHGRKPLYVRVVFPGLPILQRVVRLPAAAAADAASLVRYQMDRIVPFPLKDILWGLSPLPSGHQTEAEFLLSVTPLARLAPWLEAFRAAHLTPVAFTNQTGNSAACLPLADQEFRAPDSGRTAALALLALVLFLGTPFVWQSAAEYRLTSRLESLQPSRLVAETLRSRTEALTSGTTLLNHESQRVGSPLMLLARLTQTLPDTTFLDSLSLKQGQITLEGQSKEAARLIGLLEHDKTMRDPKFVGPLLRLPDGRGESFTLHGTVPG